jgi:hypothetical protein
VTVSHTPAFPGAEQNQRRGLLDKPPDAFNPKFDFAPRHEAA